MTAALADSFVSLARPPRLAVVTADKPSLVIGVDPGAHGAIAVLDGDGELVELHDMPSIEESAGRPATNAPLLAGILSKIPARVAFCEFVSARPTDSKTGAF